MPNWKRPAAADLWRAVDAYLSVAYDGRAPGAVRARLETLRAAPPDDLFASPVLERTEDHGAILRYSLRLGNRGYPHMKLLIEPSPDGRGHLFRIDTHDRHVRPPAGSPEERAFANLMANNQSVADAVEAALEKVGLPTFKSYLRDDLARRSALPRS